MGLVPFKCWKHNKLSTQTYTTMLFHLLFYLSPAVVHSRIASCLHCPPWVFSKSTRVTVHCPTSPTPAWPGQYIHVRPGRWENLFLLVFLKSTDALAHCLTLLTPGPKYLDLDPQRLDSQSYFYWMFTSDVDARWMPKDTTRPHAVSATARLLASHLKSSVIIANFTSCLMLWQCRLRHRSDWP